MPTEFVPGPRISRPWPAPVGAAGAAQALSLAFLLALGACAGPQPASPPLTWEQRLAVGRLDQAQAELQAGDLPAARRTAGVALAEARSAGHAPSIARAQALGGFLEGNLLRLQAGLQQLEALRDRDGAATAKLWLAELAVQADRPDLAVPAVEAAVAELPSNLYRRIESAGTEARVYHLQAAALRLAHRFAEAAAAERRAALALSLLLDGELLPLRLAVSQACGDDLLRAGDARGAISRHAAAATLARQTGDRPAELRALSSLVADFQLDGRWREAADHCERALRLARDLHDDTATRDLGARGLALLRHLGEPEASGRWTLFRGAVTGG